MFQRRRESRSMKHSGKLPALGKWRRRFKRALHVIEEQPMNESMNQTMTISRFQQHIREKYSRRDIERGSAATFMWLIEEIGELATALQGTDRENQQEEFADVLAWLCTMANIHDIDLTEAVQ